MNRSTYWILTIPCQGSFADDETVKRWFTKHVEAGRFEYVKFAHEIGEKTEYHHIQAYVVFDRQVTFDRVKGLFPKKTHIEPRFGSHLEAKDYIGNEAKSGSVVWCLELGSDESIPDKQGARSDVNKTDKSLMALQQQILAGVPEKDLWLNPETFPVMVKYYRGLQAFYGALHQHTGRKLVYQKGESQDV